MGVKILRTTGIHIGPVGPLQLRLRVVEQALLLIIGRYPLLGGLRQVRIALRTTYRTFSGPEDLRTESSSRPLGRR